MKVGTDLYTSLKKNNTAVWAMALLCLVVSISSTYMSYSIYIQSQRNIYAINEKGELVPLVKLEEKKERLKLIQSNMDYFVSLYYNLDGYTMKEKKEKVLWLVGAQPTTIIKDRDRKGYFNTFLSISGLVQYGKIDQNSWKFSSYDKPYHVGFTVNILRVNGNAKEYYKCEITATVEEVSRNYPYNPYGFIITQLNESLTKVENPDTYAQEQQEMETNNQNN